MSNYALFSVVGLEIEYMLVDKDTLDVQPKSDRVIQAIAGEIINEVRFGDTAISNELVMHVLELKNNGPRALSEPIEQHFQASIETLQPILNKENLMLLPTAAHPWMNPLSETKRWPYDNDEIYRQYDEIFDCRGHGWANLQSMHVNLPFANDEEFGQLHNTIRILLPLLPAIAASSPYLDGQATGQLDSRLEFYGRNQQRLPLISAAVIPEFIKTKAQYEHDILSPMYQEIKPHDPRGLLQYEWLNSRGAIPKFEQSAIEIRILDSQECVGADIAIARLIHAVLKTWLESSHYHLEQPIDTALLAGVYHDARKIGFAAMIDCSELCRQWQLPKRTMKMREVWHLLIERVSSSLDVHTQKILEHILSQGALSERMLRQAGAKPCRERLLALYRELAQCLVNNQIFSPPCAR